MKTVFDNAMVAHVWAQQSQPHGRSAENRVFFEGKTVYSHGYHFPMGHFWDADTVLLNCDSYSVSTSKHQGYVRGSVGHKTRRYMSTRVLKSFIRGDKKDALTLYEKEVLAKVEQFAAKAAKSNKLNKPKYLEKALSEVNAAQSFFAEWGAKLPKSLEKYRAQVNAGGDDIVKAITSRQAAETRKREKAAKLQQIEREKRAAEAIEKFKAGGVYFDRYAAQYAGKVYMRVNGDNIETSQGAEFPVAHGVKAFKLIREWKERGTPESWVKNGKTIHLGNFQIDEISSDGTVKAGCHIVQYDEIERIAKQLGVA